MDSRNLSFFSGTTRNGGRFLFVCSIFGRPSLKGIRRFFEESFSYISFFIGIDILSIFLFGREKFLWTHYIPNISKFPYLI